MNFPWFLLWLEEHDKLAGWAQFIGGVLAVVAAIMIARSQDAANRSDWERRQTALEDAALATAGRASAALRALITVLTDPARTAARLQADSALPMFPIVDAIDDLQAFPIHDLHDPLPGLVLKRLHHLIRNVESVTPEVEEATKSAGALPVKIKDMISAWELRRTNIMNDLEMTVIAARGSRRPPNVWQRAKKALMRLMPRRLDHPQ